jgi:hypothetical protein
MKHLIIATLATLFANFVSAQATIKFVGWDCDNEPETLYLMNETNQFTVRVEVTNMPEGVTGEFRCILNSNLNQQIPVTGNGIYTITYIGVGLGNPDHNIAISIWDGVSQVISNDLSLENINVWTWSPDLLDFTAIYDGQEVVMNVDVTGFLLPHGSPGYGGCAEHRLTLISQVTTTDGEGVYYVPRTLEEDFGTQEFQDFIPFTNPTSEDVVLCGRYFLRLQDMSEVSSEPDFEPVQIGTTESLCVLLEGQITTEVTELSGEQLTAFPNPFTEQVNIGTATTNVTIYTTTGEVVYSGQGGAIATAHLAPGVYLTRVEGHEALRIVKR